MLPEGVMVDFSQSPVPGSDCCVLRPLLGVIYVHTNVVFCIYKMVSVLITAFFSIFWT